MKDGYISQYKERNYAPRKKKLEKKDLVNQRKINESVRKENALEAHQQRQQRVQISTERRPEAQEEDISIEKKELIMKVETTKHKKKKPKN